MFEMLDNSGASVCGQLLWTPESTVLTDVDALFEVSSTVADSAYTTQGPCL